MQLKKLLMQVSKTLAIIIAIAYPIAVFFALRNGLSIRMIGLFLMCVALIGVVQCKNVAFGVCGFILALITCLSDKEIFLKLYPVLMNLCVCGIFALSLIDVPLAERFAEKMKYQMTEHAKHYARNVTIAWAVFMGINTIISLITVFMSDWAWTLYNGFVSYCLVGTMMLGEYIIRTRIMREQSNK